MCNLYNLYVVAQHNVSMLIIKELTTPDVNCYKTFILCTITSLAIPRVLSRCESKLVGEIQLRRPCLTAWAGYASRLMSICKENKPSVRG